MRVLLGGLRGTMRMRKYSSQCFGEERGFWDLGLTSVQVGQQALAQGR